MTSAEVFNCILCKETFDNKDELQIHFRKHGDPKFNESIKTKSRGQNEAVLANERSNDAAEMINCDVCDEVFPTISKAITHKHKVHPEHDAKYFCPWCGKLFTMKHLYNKHLQTNHDAAEEVSESEGSHFQCDSCNVYFFVPAAMVYHNKFFHRQDTDLPIIGHSKKQKLFNQDLLPIYYCSFCGEEYINKVNLHKHICDDHGDENQRPSDVLRCPLCEAIFYHLDAYELHLTFHSSEDLYSETNEMNEQEMTEFSLETVPPSMERIEDLNNLPDGEANVNAMGIESFLQMAMEESNGDQPEKIKSKKHKKHKKHKKSKKPAISLDEFLSMNQDVFGEDIDFQGIEEVPTKVIKKQLKVKKPTVSKAATKLVSSADLQKLQKAGIVVKVPSGKKIPLTKPVALSKVVGQPVKVNPQVKNLTIQSKTKAISASDEVLSKLLNQSSSQLKIVKKSVQEKAYSNEPDANELSTNNYTDTTENEVHEPTEPASKHMETNGEDNENINNDDKANITPVRSPQKNPSNTKDNEDINTEKTSMSATNKDGETENNVISNENNKDQKQLTKSHQIQSANVSTKTHVGNAMNDSLKNIGKYITIKPVVPTVIKLPILEKPETARLKVNEKVEEPISPKIDLKVEQNDIHKNKSLETLKNLNSAITIKSLKNVSVLGPNNSSTTTIEQTDQTFKQASPNDTESSPTTQSKTETTVETGGNSKPVQVTPSSQVLRNISKNITVKSMSPHIKYLNDEVTNDENDFDDYDDDEHVENRITDVPSSTLDRLKNVATSHKLNPAKPQIVDSEEEKSHNEPCDEDKELKYTNIQSGNNLLKRLKNITGKPVASKSITQENTAKSNNVNVHVMKENVIKKPIHSKEISQDIEIFNIDDSDDEVDKPKEDNREAPPVKLEPIEPDVKSQATLNAIKNISKNVTVKSSNNQAILQEIIKRNESNTETEPFSDEDEMHNDPEYDSNDDYEEHPTSHGRSFISNQKEAKKENSLKNVLKHLGKHITVKSGNASPSPSIKSLDHSSQDFQQNTAANHTDSDDEYCSGKVKITEITKEDEEDFDGADDFDNTGVVTQSPEDSNSEDEHCTRRIEETDECENQNVNISKNSKSDSGSLLKNISKNITVKSLTERAVVNEDKTDLPENELVVNQSKLSKDLLTKPVKQNKPVEGPRNSGMPNVKRMDETSFQGSNIQPKQAKPGVSVNKEVKVKTFQSETVIEEITTTVTKTIRRVNQTVNQQVFNASHTSPSPRMIRPKGPRMGVQSNNLQGVTVRQSPPASVRPKIRHAIPFRPPASGSIVKQPNQLVPVRPSNQLVPVRPSNQLVPVRTSNQLVPVRPSNQLVPVRPNVPQVRPSNSPRMPRMPVKNMPRQPRPVGKPLKISPNVVNHTLKRPSNDEPQGHFSCFKKPKESLFPGNDSMEACADFQYASSSQTNKFCSTTQRIKGSSVMTSAQMKSESVLQQQQINKLGNVSGLKIAKTSEVSQVERTEMSASKRSALEAIQKLQKQGLLVKKPRVEEPDPPNSGGEDNEEYDDEEYDV